MRRPRTSRQMEGSEGDGLATAIAGGSEEVVGRVRVRRSGQQTPPSGVAEVSAAHRALLGHTV